MPSTCAAATTRAPPKWCLLLRSAPFAALSMRAAGGLCQKVARPEPCACAGGGFGRGKMALVCRACDATRVERARPGACKRILWRHGVRCPPAASPSRCFCLPSILSATYVATLAVAFMLPSAEPRARAAGRSRPAHQHAASRSSPAAPPDSLDTASPLRLLQDHELVRGTRTGLRGSHTMNATANN